MNVPIVIDPVTGSGVTWLATLTYYANETKAVPVTAARNIDDKYGVSTVISVTGSVNLPDGRGFSVSSGDSLDFGFIASRSTGDVDLDFTTIPSNGTTNLIGARKNIDLDKEASAGSKSVLVMFIGQYIDGGDGIPIREYNTVVNTTSGDHGLDLSKTIRFSNVRNTFINNIIKFTKTTGSRLWTVSMLAEDYGVTGKTTQTLAPSGYSYLDVARFRSNANNGWVLKIINQPPDYKFNLAVRMQDPNGAVHDYRLFTTPTVTSGYTDLNVDMASSGGYKFEKRSSNPAEYVIGEWSVIGVRYDWSPQDYWFDDPATSTDLMYCMIRSFTPGKRKFSIPYVAPIPPVIVETATGTDAVNTSSTGQGFLTSGYNDSTGTPVGATGITRVSFIDDSVSGRSNTLKNLNSKSSSVSNLTKGWVIGGYSQFNALVSAVSQSVEEMDLVSVTTNICQASADGRALAASVSSANNGYVISGLVGGAPQAVGTTLVFNFTSRASTTTTAAVAKGNNCGVMSNDYGYSAGGDWWTYTRRDNEKISFATSTTLGTISAMLNADKGRMYGLSSKVTGKGYFAYGIMSAADAGKAVESIDFYTDTNIRVLATAGSGSQRGSIQSHDAGYTCDTGGVQKIVFLTETAYTSTSDLITRDFTTGLSANPWTY
jgi:hypothetical protein